MTVRERLKQVVKTWPALYNWIVCCKQITIPMAWFLRTGSCCRREYCLLPEKKLIYLINSKVACSSIKASMYHMPEQENYHAVHNIAWETKKVVFDGDSPRYAEYYKFSFVRNPFDRLVSCYENKYHTDVEIDDQGALQFSSYLMGYLKDDRGFREFARRVARIPDRFADAHFVSQYFMLCDHAGRLLVDFIGRFETLEADYEPIRVKYDLALLSHYNQTKKKGNWMDYYDKETAVRVYKRYQRDIEAFGYEEAYQTLLKYIHQKDGLRK